MKLDKNTAHTLKEGDLLTLDGFSVLVMYKTSFHMSGLPAYQITFKKHTGQVIHCAPLNQFYGYEVVPFNESFLDLYLSGIALYNDEDSLNEIVELASWDDVLTDAEYTQVYMAALNKCLRPGVSVL